MINAMQQPYLSGQAGFAPSRQNHTPFQNQQQSFPMPGQQPMQPQQPQYYNPQQQAGYNQQQFQPQPQQQLSQQYQKQQSLYSNQTANSLKTQQPQQMQQQQQQQNIQSQSINYTAQSSQRVSAKDTPSHSFRLATQQQQQLQQQQQQQLQQQQQQQIAPGSPQNQFLIQQQQQQVMEEQKKKEGQLRLQEEAEAKAKQAEIKAQQEAADLKAKHKEEKKRLRKQRKEQEAAEKAAKIQKEQEAQEILKQQQEEKLMQQLQEEKGKQAQEQASQIQNSQIEQVQENLERHEISQQEQSIIQPQNKSQIKEMPISSEIKATNLKNLENEDFSKQNISKQEVDISQNVAAYEQKQEVDISQNVAAYEQNEEEEIGDQEQINYQYNKSNISRQQIQKEEQSNFSRSQMQQSTSTFKSPKGPKHFDTAYNELTIQIMEQAAQESTDKINIYQLLLSPQKVQTIDQKKQARNKNYQKELNERLTREKEIMQERVEQLAENYEQQELDECTFTPQILNYEQTGEKRNFDEFLQKEYEYSEYLKMKKQQQKAQEEAIEEQEATFTPDICIKSEQILQKKKGFNNQKAHERLYNLSKKKKEPFHKNTKEGANFFPQANKKSNQPTFKPKIQKRSQNIVRNQKIDLLLYSDALRRQQVQQHHELEKQTKIQIPKSHYQSIKQQQSGVGGSMKLSHSIVQSQNYSDKLIGEKMILDFEQISQHLLGQCRDKLRFDYINLGELLYRMGFISNRQEVMTAAQNISSNFTKERTLVFDIWVILQGEKYKGIYKQNLCLLLLAVIGIYWKAVQVKQVMELYAQALPKDEQEYPNDEYEDQQQQQEQQEEQEEGDNQMPEEFYNRVSALRSEDLDKLKIGNFIVKNGIEEWDITFAEGTLLHKKFDFFYRNMLANEELKQIRNDYSYQFEPTILENSKALAEQHREKLLEETAKLIEDKTLDVQVPENGRVTHADLLIIQKRAQQLQKQRVKEYYEQEQVNECTFKPNTNNYYSGIQSQNSKNEEFDDQDARKSRQCATNSQGVKRAFELYSLAKPYGQRKDKQTCEIEYEKQCDQCTFNPDLTMTKSDKSYFAPREIYAKDIDKTIERLRNARAQREVETWWKDGRGYDLPKPTKNQSIASSSQINQSKSKEQSMSNSQVQVQIQQQYSSNQYDDEEPQEQEQQEYLENEMPQDQYENQDQQNDEPERIPLLFVDVNLGQNRTERIIVYEGDDSQELADRFADLHQLQPHMKIKLKEMLDAQISGILHRIDEEMPSVNSEQDSNRKDIQN